MEVESDTVVLRVHLAAGVAWFAGVSRERKFVNDRLDRLTLQDVEQGEPRALHEFEESLEALFLRIAPTTVALLNAGQSKQAQSPLDARKRGWLEGMIMLAVHRTPPALVRVTHGQVEAHLDARPAAKALRGKLSDKLTSEPPPKWNCRAPAFAAALVLVDGTEQQ